VRGTELAASPKAGGFCFLFCVANYNYSMNELMAPLSDQDLVSRLKNFEDNFVERKTSGDSRDWVKTVVAFANSTPIGYPAILFIGVRDDGTPEGNLDLDTLQKTFASKMQVIYPPVYFVTKILGHDSVQFLAIIVPGSTDRPHFAGPSYIRKGSKTEIASEQHFDELLASRSSKSGEILKWMKKEVTIDWMRVEHTHQLGAIAGTTAQIVPLAICSTSLLRTK
jgi:predicted HTH transcriptional regulator